MKVVNFTFARDNPYSRMMYCALGEEFEPRRGTAEDALKLLRAGESQIFHIHWEELLLRDCPTEAEATLMSQHFLSQVKEFRSLGGKVVWTIHNELPHELQFVDLFLRLRRELATCVDKISVHSHHALRVMQEQCALDPKMAVVLPHPSYLGEYEPMARQAPHWTRPKERNALAFGKIRPYKGYSALLKAWKSAGEPSTSLRIVGEAPVGSSYAEALKAEHSAVPNIDFDFRKVPPEEVASLVRSARCLVLPYERHLTSGVASLAMTLGVPVVAPDTPGMRETLPPANHPLLFSEGSTTDLMRALNQALDLSAAERNEISEQDFERTLDLAPQRISQKLGEIFRAL